MQEQQQLYVMRGQGVAQGNPEVADGHARPLLLMQYARSPAEASSAIQKALLKGGWASCTIDEIAPANMAPGVDPRDPLARAVAHAFQYGSAILIYED